MCPTPPDRSPGLRGLEDDERRENPPLRHAGREQGHPSSSISRYPQKKAPLIFSPLSCLGAFWSVFLAPLCSSTTVRGVDKQVVTSPLLPLRTSFISSLLNASLFSSTVISPPSPSASPLITTFAATLPLPPSDAPSLLVAENERVLKPAARSLCCFTPACCLQLSLSLSRPLSPPASLSLFLNPPLSFQFLFTSLCFPAISLPPPALPAASLQRDSELVGRWTCTLAHATALLATRLN